MTLGTKKQAKESGSSEAPRVRRFAAIAIACLAAVLLAVVGYFAYRKFATPAEPPVVTVLTDQERSLAKVHPNLEELFERADEGDEESSLVLGNMFLRGIGVEKNLASAKKWLTMAAEQGNLDAQNNLGYLYKLNNNDAEAVRWYRKAADAGDSNAQLNLAVLLKEKRLGDDAQIVDLLRMSIKDDPDMRAHFYLAWLFLNDDNSSNDEEGLDLMVQAAANGHPQAAYVMGQIFEDGHFVDRDPIASAGWYAQALQKGYVPAGEKLGPDGKLKSGAAGGHGVKPGKGQSKAKVKANAKANANWKD